ncbi:MAG TPA: hypothetical protein VF178_02250 [Gemmatimonadaceae bacterium]
MYVRLLLPLLLPLTLLACSTLRSPGPYAPPPRADLVRPYELAADTALGPAKPAALDTLVADSVRVKGSGGFLRPRYFVLQAPESEMPQAELDARRDSLAAERAPWTPLSAVRDSLPLRQSWRRVRAAMVPGTVLPLRRSVWPADAHVSAREDSLVLFQAEWVPFERFSAREVRCATVPRTRKGVRGAEIRLAAALVPTPHGEATVWVWPETHRANGCRLSPEGVDRARALLLDLWTAMYRATALGTDLRIW